MKKSIKTFLLFLIIFFSALFMFQNDIKANPDDPNSSLLGEGGNNTEGVPNPTGPGTWIGAYGFYIKIYDQSNTHKKTIDVKAKDSFSADWKISELKNWIVVVNDQITPYPTVLYDYLDIPYGNVSGDYSNLLKLINTTLNIGDYITIEPYTIINSKKYTFRQIINSNEIYYKCEEMKCDKYTCAEYEQTCSKRSTTQCEKYSSACQTYSKTKCATYKCDKYNTKCVEKGLFGCKKRVNTTCKTYSKTKCATYKCDKYKCSTYKCVEYKDTDTCKTYSTECEIRSTTECAKVTPRIYYDYYAPPAIILANAASVGSNITVGNQTFTAPTTSCNSSLYGNGFCGYSSNKNIGYGITVVRYEDIYQNGKVKISIKRKDTNQLIITKNAKFAIYDASNKKITDVTTTSGVAEYSLKAGSYKIEEISSPQDYNLVSNNPVNINIKQSEITEQDFFYSTGCEADLAYYEEIGLGKDVNTLISLYNTHKKIGLLNFGSPSCTATCNESKKVDSLSCLSGSKTLSTTFNENNLICNNEVLTDLNGNFIGACANYFTLNNNLGRNKFYGTSGQFLIRQSNNILKIYDEHLNPVEINNPYVATAQSGKVCYILNGINYDMSSDMKSNSVYFGDVDDDLQADLLNSDEIVSLNPIPTWGSVFTKHTYELTYNYKLSKEIYLEKITGKYSNVKTNKTTDETIYGILSKFNSSSGNIPFSISYDDETYTSDQCEYETKEEIIKFNPSDLNDNGKLDLEFRIIDTNIPFERDTNSNWCNESDCSYDNNIVQTYIKDRNNSYNVTSEGSWYTNQSTGKARIVLTPAIIKEIREYNQNHPYDDYELVCDRDGNNCENAFLKQFNIVKVI